MAHQIPNFKFLSPLTWLLPMIFAGNVLAQTNSADTQNAETPAATETPTENFSFHWQSTYINHQKNNFASSYSGRNSLLNRTEGGGTNSYSFSGTAYIGARLGKNTEVYYNPETFQGVPFGGQLTGLGGFQNGELQKGAFTSPVFYNARAFVRQTIGLGEEKEYLNGEANQLAGFVPKNRLVLTLGRVSTLDFFDDNAYSHDARTHFQNFSIFSMGAYGYGADTKGFTFGAVSELYLNQWIFKAARFALPAIPNTADLDRTLRKNYGDQFEITRLYELGGQPGAVRALIYSQHANMAAYQNAIAWGTQTRQVPDLVEVRAPGTKSWGYGFNAEQAANEDLGFFARWSWNPGTTETQTLDMKTSLSGGLSLKGSAWSRPDDTFGLGVATNGISALQVQYMKQGGMTAFIGDGNIDYRKERVIEAFYSAKLPNDIYLTLDLQRIQNPGFNSKRGPINLLGMRLHFEI
jgi:high affinity Mn2+ porin